MKRFTARQPHRKAKTRQPQGKNKKRLNQTSKAGRFSKKTSTRKRRRGGKPTGDTNAENVSDAGGDVVDFQAWSGGGVEFKLPSFVNTIADLTKELLATLATETAIGISFGQTCDVYNNSILSIGHEPVPLLRNAPIGGMRNFQYNIRDFIKDASAKTLAQKLTPPFPTPFTFSEKLEYAHSIVDIFETRCAYYVDTFGRNPKPADIATIATARSIPQFSAVNIFLNPDGAVGMTRERLPNATPDGLAKSIANDDVCVLSPEELIRVYSPKVNRDVRLRIMNGKSGCIQPIVRNSAEPLIKLDTWALGLLLCHIFSNSVRSPFQSIQSIDLEASTPNIIENTFVNEPNLSDVTPVEARTLIGALLHKNPAERPSLEAIRNDPLLRVKWNDKGSFDLARGWERATEGVSGMNPRGVKGLLSASVVDYTPFGTDQARFTRKYKELLPVANADAS